MRDSTFGAIIVETGVDPELGILCLRRAVGRYRLARRARWRRQRVGIPPHDHPVGDALLLLMYERGKHRKTALLWDMEYPQAKPGL